MGVDPGANQLRIDLLHGEGRPLANPVDGDGLGAAGGLEVPSPGKSESHCTPDQYVTSNGT